MGKRDFKRKTEQRRQNPRFLIVSEGEATEPEYLLAVRRRGKISSADVVIVPPPPTSPREIVTKARDFKKTALKDDPYDAVWCLFDVEYKVTQNCRPGLADAIQMARDNNISIALSNPCFELWILLHSQDCQATIYSDTVQQRCSTLGLVRQKHLCNPNQILDHYQIACQRAKNLDIFHDRDGRHRHKDRNPSSTVYKLMEAIYQAFPPHS